MPDQSAGIRLAGDKAASAPGGGFRSDVLTGLRQDGQRAIPARWFYDKTGSELFEEITRIPEYYPTRVETDLLRDHARELASYIGAGAAIVEFGSGSSTKTPVLLRALAPQAYVPIDISGEFLHESAGALAEEFPNLRIEPVAGDFTHRLRLPVWIDHHPRLGFFPGSTIGNLAPEAAVDLLRTMHETLGEGAWLLIGMDRIKDPALLLPAYDDAGGITARFNLNLLERINRELDGTIPVDGFRHKVVWNDFEARIEMHLEARRDLEFDAAGESFTMAEGETIHTENSHKYGLRDARLLLRAGGWAPIREWSDADDMFSLILAQARPRPSAP